MPDSKNREYKIESAPTTTPNFFPVAARHAERSEASFIDTLLLSKGSLSSK